MSTPQTKAWAEPLIKGFQPYLVQPLPKRLSALCVDGIAVGVVRSSVLTKVAHADGLSALFTPCSVDGPFSKKGLTVKRSDWSLCQERLLQYFDIEPLHEAIPLPLASRDLTIDRALCRTLGIPTQVVRLVWEENGHILLARRAATKRINPGLWDNPAAGMIRSGETPEEALLREAQEEASLVPKEDICQSLSFSTQRPLLSGILRETTFVTHVRRSTSKRTVPYALDREVEEFGWFSMAHLQSLLSTGKIVPEASYATLLALATN